MRGVDGVWLEHLTAGTSVGGAEVVLPFGAAVIAVATAPIERATPDGWERLPAAALIGVQTRMQRYRVAADGRVLHVRLSPGALAGLDVPEAAMLTDRIVDLAALDAGARGWQRALAADDAGALEIRAALERRLAAAPPVHREVDRALVDLVPGPGGEVEASPARVGERQLFRLMHAQVGTSLRTLRELARLRLAIGERGRGSTWAQAAAAAGFADQSHLVRVCRRVTGLSPGGLERLAPAALRALARMSG